MSNTSNSLTRQPPTLEQMVDLARYPIHDLNHPKTRQLIDDCRERLDDDGCALLKDFMLPASLERMQAESDRLYDQTFWTEATHNPYFTADDPTLDESHPKRHFEERSSGYINSDLLEEDSDLRAIYASPIVTRFIGECLNVWPLYCWSDPLGCNPYSVMDTDNYFPWHFDGNNFTVSILVQESEAGGVFEYASDLRTPEDENFAVVRQVLEGARGRVKQLDLCPGDMQIFKGRYSMHRVTRIEGQQRRVIALPSYVTDDYGVNRPAHSIHLYGKALPIHYEREAYRSDSLTD
uniref:Fe2OG dioxygenase domain-containing protein n=1 Tax=uncultured Thiotrichaceae bacterium TaxID=298394 RepID=A0A6S6TTC9_9GAMM|nr:MAG: Unknown protein [uncultured Thiotrichaceae bacterium]